MGSGFKDFAATDILTAAQVDDYLMRQTVMTFASATARNTALSADLEEGMHAYTTDTDTLYYYNGSTWIILSEPAQTWTHGDITQSGAVNTTTASGYYQRCNGMFRAMAYVDATTNGATGNDVYWSSPLTTVAAGALQGTVLWKDASSNTRYVGQVVGASTTTFRAMRDGQTQYMGNAPSLAVVSGDQFIIELHGRHA